MTDTDTVRRHPNGSIDYDFYRARATAMRGAAMRDAMVSRRFWRGMAMAIGALAIVLIASAPPAPQTRTASVAVVAQAD